MYIMALAHITEDGVRCRMCGNLLTTMDKYRFEEINDMKEKKTLDSDHSDIAIQTITVDNSKSYDIIQFNTVNKNSLKSTSVSTLPYSLHHPGYQYEQVICSKCNNPVGIHYILTETLSNKDEEKNKDKFSDSTLDSLSNKSKEIKDEEMNFDPNQEVISEEDEEIETIIKKSYLSMKSVIKTNGWWTYEINNKIEVTQYHLQGNGQTTEKNPLYSLGKFNIENSYDIGFTTIDSLNYKYYSHKYDNGQHCDETGIGRQTEIRYVTCKSNNPVLIMSINEEKVCEYVINVCIPALKEATYYFDNALTNPDTTIVKDQFFSFPLHNILIDSDPVLTTIIPIGSHFNSNINEDINNINNNNINKNNNEQNHAIHEQQPNESNEQEL
ncbi:hypothetical protein WA158_006477 [Blastocystis sp. Blastoise]